MLWNNFVPVRQIPRKFSLNTQPIFRNFKFPFFIFSSFTYFILFLLNSFEFFFPFFFKFPAGFYSGHSTSFRFPLKLSKTVQIFFKFHYYFSKILIEFLSSLKIFFIFFSNFSQISPKLFSSIFFFKHLHVSQIFYLIWFLHCSVINFHHLWNFLQFSPLIVSIALSPGKLAWKIEGKRKNYNQDFIAWKCWGKSSNHAVKSPHPYHLRNHILGALVGRSLQFFQFHSETEENMHKIPLIKIIPHKII